jgi:hypothetical protein
MSIGLANGRASMVRATLVSLLLALSLGFATEAPTASAAGHNYSHGTLWCDSGYAGVGRGMTASVVGGEHVRLTHTLYRWTNQGWVRVSVAPTVRTNPAYGGVEYVTAEYSDWFTLNGVFSRQGQFPRWPISLRGYYYAIAEEIVWVNSSGVRVDSHSGWVTASNGYYCYF